MPLDGNQEDPEEQINKSNEKMVVIIIWIFFSLIVVVVVVVVVGKRKEFHMISMGWFSFRVALSPAVHRWRARARRR